MGAPRELSGTPHGSNNFNRRYVKVPVRLTGPVVGPRTCMNQVIDTTKEFFKYLSEIATPDYMPTDEHILLSRVRTTGIVEETYVIKKHTYVMFDVGGQRNERKKWIHCFDGVNAVIFVAALSEFDQMLFEDEGMNRMVRLLA